MKESTITPLLDAWLAELFDETNLDQTCEALAMAGDPDDASEARAEGARRKIADCDQRLARYRQALDSGADAAVVAGWMAEVYRDLGVQVHYDPHRRIVSVSAGPCATERVGGGTRNFAPCPLAVESTSHQSFAGRHDRVSVRYRLLARAPWRGAQVAASRPDQHHAVRLGYDRG